MIALYRLRFGAFLETRALHSWRFSCSSERMAWRLWVDCGYIGHAYAHAAFLSRRDRLVLFYER